MPASRKTIAVVFGAVGGLSDVGKMAVLQLLDGASSVDLRSVLMFHSSERPSLTAANRPIVTTDVTDEALQERVAAAVADANPAMVEVGSDDAQETLEGAFAGVDAIVVAIGNRQPWKPRTLAPSMVDIREAAVVCKVPRLVVLSSFGLSGDPLPWKWIRYGWALMLSTVSRSAWHDLVAMEAAAQDTGGSIDVLIVRPTGLTPKLSAIGEWRLFRSRADLPIAYGIAKQDVAKFMVQEAVTPTLHNAVVTIGGVPWAYDDAEEVPDNVLSH
eukprot:m.205906 g.205906  ORF g.205906 m.205906 type:complete len:272 (-) comp25334_c1_seq17:136-951(-)